HSLAYAYNNAIDLDDEDFTLIKDNNIAENLFPIPSNSSFKNYS
ncbi:24024_t:CDS:1, partial [Dentiscutata erythropus]